MTQRMGKGRLDPRTVRNVHMLIHLMLADACDAGLLERDVAARRSAAHLNIEPVVALMADDMNWQGARNGLRCWQSRPS